jgi:hypothetical protein
MGAFWPRSVLLDSAGTRHFRTWSPQNVSLFLVCNLPSIWAGWCMIHGPANLLYSWSCRIRF